MFLVGADDGAARAYATRDAAAAVAHASAMSVTAREVAQQKLAALFPMGKGKALTALQAYESFASFVNQFIGATAAKYQDNDWCVAAPAALCADVRALTPCDPSSAGSEVPCAPLHMDLPVGNAFYEEVVKGGGFISAARVQISAHRAALVRSRRVANALWDQCSAVYVIGEVRASCHVP